MTAADLRLNARALAMNFRQNPRHTFRLFVVGALLRLTVCRVVGHKHGNFYRLGGVCDRCWFTA